MSRLSRSLMTAIPICWIIMVLGCQVPAPPQRADGWQGWSDDERVAWYTASQGSRLIPRDWLDNLEQPGDSTAPFLDPAYIESFRYLPNPTAGKTSPDAGCPFDRSCRWDSPLIASKTACSATPGCDGRPPRSPTSPGSG